MIFSGISLAVIMMLTLLMAYWLNKKSSKVWIQKVTLGVNFLMLLGLLFWAGNLVVPHLASAATVGTGSSDATGLGYLAAGLAVGLASIGAGIGAGIAGSSAIGSISEKPEMLGRTLIFVGLAEGVAIYGLIISIMILGRL